MARKRTLLILLSLILIMLSTLVISAYLTDQKEREKTLTLGYVNVSLVKVYYMVEDEEVDASHVVVLDRTKNGVYDINITDPSKADYITHLRIDFYVTSNVDSYLRVKFNDQIVRKTVNYQGVITETAVLHTPTTFFTDANWHKEVDAKNIRNTYYYFQNTVKQEGSTPLKITCVVPYPEGSDYSAYSEEYSLQLGIYYEIVQANHGGPLHNWGLEERPWGGEW